MAAVKKSIQSNIIKMKLTEEKRYKSFRLWLILVEMRLSVLGICSTRVTEFDSLTENLDSGRQTCTTSL